MESLGDAAVLCGLIGWHRIETSDDLDPSRLSTDSHGVSAYTAPCLRCGTSLTWYTDLLQTNNWGPDFAIESGGSIHHRVYRAFIGTETALSRGLVDPEPQPSGAPARASD